ncbi:MAG TPA: hypothetical protein ACFYEK_04470 [Candidatus Wunengus sp. YC60]|uniref:hypothetical protein n=1 Tax=Candidatus Wunengus sp. YC60 TaxID=3367697 RepID=UPI00402875CA
MGQATINSGGPTGLYNVKIVKDAGKSVARQTDITTRLADLVGLITMATTNVNTALAELASAQTTLNDAIAAMVDETTRKAVTDATTAVLTKQQSVSRARMTYASLIVEQQSLQKEQARLTTAMADESLSAWCADLTENLAVGATVGTAEINGVGDQIIILPGGATTNALGKLQHSGVSTGAAVFYNKALLPCWQKWMPTYRVGTITELDKEADTASVTLDVAVGEQGLDINQEASLVDIPIEYMTYNASAFNVGRRVLIEFEDQEWSGAKIIGFESYPGAGMDYYFIHNFETAVDQPDYVWDMEYPGDYILHADDVILDSDAKFGQYAGHVTQASHFEMVYEPANTTDEFWPPLTYEFWFKWTYENMVSGEIDIWGWKELPGGWINMMYECWFHIEEGLNPCSYMRDNVYDTYSNTIATDEYPIPFTFGIYNHYAAVILPERIKVFLNGALFKEYISPEPDGFNVMYNDFFCFNGVGGKLLIDALSITQGEKYTTNFTPPTAPPSV